MPFMHLSHNLIFGCLEPCCGHASNCRWRIYYLYIQQMRCRLRMLLSAKFLGMFFWLKRKKFLVFCKHQAASYLKQGWQMSWTSQMNWLLMLGYLWYDHKTQVKYVEGVMSFCAVLMWTACAGRAGNFRNLAQWSRHTYVCQTHPLSNPTQV